MAKQLSALIIFVFPIIVFVSCEGYRCAQGTVVDMETKLPLDSVVVEVITAQPKYQFSDSLGMFKVCNSIGKCTPDCKDIMIRFSKSNYKTITLINPEKDAIVIMEKE